MKLNAFIGSDLVGDTTIYVQWLREDGEHFRYLEPEEIEPHLDDIVKCLLKPTAPTPRPIWDGKSVAGGTFERGE